MADNLTSIFDPAVKSLPIHENGEKLVAIEPSKRIFVSDKYEPYYPTFKLVRESVFERLTKAASELPDGVNFLFVEGHRPLEIQIAFFKDYSDLLQSRHPEWDEERVFNEATKLVAPPSKTPPHSTGAAFDLTLCDDEGNELDLGSPIDDDPDKNNGMNMLKCPLLNDEAQKNREILTNALNSNGFTHYDYEWWHWSYGDQYWAYKRAEQHALYNSIGCNDHPLWRDPIAPKLLD